MAIVTRDIKSTALTHTEMDNNFKELDYHYHIQSNAPLLTGSTQDESSGVLVGSRIYSTSDGYTYICTDNTNGSAIWEKQVDNVEFHVSQIDPVSDDNLSVGYIVGSQWLNTSNGTTFECTASNDISATWVEKHSYDTDKQEVENTADTYIVATLTELEAPLGTSTLVDIELSGLKLLTTNKFINEKFSVIIASDLGTSETHPYIVQTVAGVDRSVTIERLANNTVTIKITDTEYAVSTGTNTSKSIMVNYKITNWNDNIQTIVKADLV